MVLAGMFEFLESYFDGDVDIEGEHGLRRLVNIGYRKPFGRLEHPLTWTKRRLLEWRQDNRSFAQAKRNAACHYGMPTEFFRNVLGDTLGYTEGHWDEGTRTLDEAQHNNFDLICRKLGLRPGLKLVEIGPGWGYMAMLAAQRYGADVTVMGSSPARTKPCGSRCAHAGSRATSGSSRGTIANYCTIKHIFPGGYIPGLAETLLLMEKHGLDLLSIENRSHHYHRTVECWLANLEANWERIRSIDPIRFDEKFRTTWLFYLGGAAETFEAAREIINCFHITFVKGHFARRNLDLRQGAGLAQG